jgi:hypothetical protein
MLGPLKYASRILGPLWCLATACSPLGGAEATADGGVAKLQCPDGEALRELTRLSISYKGQEPLSQYALNFAVDTRTWVRDGSLAADCSNLAIALGDEILGPWVPPGECDSITTVAWFRVARLQAGAQTALVGACGRDTAGKPEQIFSAFEGFDQPRDWTGPVYGWRRHGTAVPIQNGDGFLRLPQGGPQRDVAVEASSMLVRAGMDAVGIRFRTRPGRDDDLEVGVGTITGPALWHVDRQGSWVTSLYWELLANTMGNGAECYVTNHQEYRPDDNWHDAEVAYRTDEQTHADTSLAIPAPRPYSASSTTCGALPASLPALLVLDHSPLGANPEVLIDWIYVRPRAVPEPTVLSE